LVKELCYKTYIRPVLEYACPAWQPALESDKYLLERVQRRAARFICNNYEYNSSVTQMLQHLKLDTIELRHTFLSQVYFFQIINNLTGIDGGRYLAPPTYRSARLDHDRKVQEVPARLEIYKTSFFPRNIKIWNALDAEIVNCLSLDNFKTKLQCWLSENQQ
jgi:hypothetical protein